MLKGPRKELLQSFHNKSTGKSVINTIQIQEIFKKLEIHMGSFPSRRKCPTLY